MYDECLGARLGGLETVGYGGDISRADFSIFCFFPLFLRGRKGGEGMMRL